MKVILDIIKLREVILKKSCFLSDIDYPKTFGKGSTPPPFPPKCPKEGPKQITPKLLDYGWTPTPPFGQCPKGSTFFQDYLPK